MSRPRHRRKSSLLWKMLVVASAINLVLWPVLIHEGIFPGIRHEILIPVFLVTVPAPHKLPDTLRLVSRPPRVAVASAAPAKAHPPAPPRPSVSPHPSPSLLALAKPEAAAVPGAPRLAPQAPRPALAPHATLPVHPAPPHTKAAHAPQELKTAARPKSAGTPLHHLNPVLAARIARAKRLEAEGHQVALLIAQQRASREAALSPFPVPPPVPIVLAAPTVPAALVPASPPARKKAVVVRKTQPPVQSHDSPAIAILDARPTVPDAMMTTAWHATFRGAFLVRPDGSAKAYMVSSTGFPVLDRRALAAARRWKFRPARRNGAAVAARLPFAFAFDVHPAH